MVFQRLSTVAGVNTTGSAVIAYLARERGDMNVALGAGAVAGPPSAPPSGA